MRRRPEGRTAPACGAQGIYAPRGVRRPFMAAMVYRAFAHLRPNLPSVQRFHPISSQSTGPIRLKQLTDREHMFYIFEESCVESAMRLTHTRAAPQDSVKTRARSSSAGQM